MTKLEQVARALAERAYNDLDFGTHFPSPAAYADASWRQWTPFARDSALALREPSEGMVQAGASAADWWAGPVRVSFTAAIDAVLSEGEG
jgi:hypothetical protein